MKYIYVDDDGTTFFDQYFEYLEEIRDSLPKSLRTFACDHEVYDLSSRTSLHDAWLLRFLVTVGSTENSARTDTEIRLELLGAYHDRIHHIHYKSVVGFDILGENGTLINKSDLLIHEFRLEDNRLIHEMRFDNSGCILIQFLGFEYFTEIIEKS